MTRPLMHQLTENRRLPPPRQSLDIAEGILIALRHCNIDDAFHEIIQTAWQYPIPVFTLASALVTAAAGDPAGTDPAAREAVRSEWGQLLGLRGPQTAD
jgi:hypothetical protein